jgi:hypothetical protein
VPDPENGDRALVVVYLVDDAEVADSDTPTSSICQSAATRWAEFFE